MAAESMDLTVRRDAAGSLKMKKDTLILMLLVVVVPALAILCWKAGAEFGRTQSQVDANTATLARHDARLLALEEDGRLLRKLNTAKKSVIGWVSGLIGF